MSIQIKIDLSDEEILKFNIVPSKTNSALVAKKLIGSKPPYVFDRRPDGYVVIFSQHFIDAYRKALSHNCVANMTEKEKDLYFGFVEWSNKKEHSDISDIGIVDKVYDALDTWTTDELMGNPHPDYITCEEI